MAKYVKKPVVIEAWQFGSQETMPEWLVDAENKNIVRHSMCSDCLYIDTFEGTHRANKGDYIIRGVRGELYPCKPDIFKETYELFEGEVEKE